MIQYCKMFVVFKLQGRYFQNNVLFGQVNEWFTNDLQKFFMAIGKLPLAERHLKPCVDGGYSWRV